MTSPAPPGITFRELRVQDTSALGELFEANDVPPIIDHFDPFPLTRDMAAELTNPGRKDRFYGAFLNDRLVAFSMLRGWEDGFEVPTFGIFVDRQHHGRGIGSRLTDFTINQARALDSPSVRLSVYGTNKHAYSMYERKGFREQSRAFIQRGDRPDERIIMVLVLASEG